MHKLCEQQIMINTIHHISIPVACEYRWQNENKQTHTHVRHSTVFFPPRLLSVHYCDLLVSLELYNMTDDMERPSLVEITVSFLLPLHGYLAPPEVEARTWQALAAHKIKSVCRELAGQCRQMDQAEESMVRYSQGYNVPLSHDFIFNVNVVPRCDSLDFASGCWVFPRTADLTLRIHLHSMKRCKSRWVYTASF